MGVDAMPPYSLIYCPQLDSIDCKNDRDFPLGLVTNLIDSPDEYGPVDKGLH